MAQESGGIVSVIMDTRRCYPFLMVLVICGLCTLTGATKCYKNEGLGDVVGNVYNCTGDMDECCEEEQEFTCCEPTAEKSLKEQLILWGGVGAVVLVIALACCYFWKDCNCLREDTRCCRCCKSKKVDEDPLTSINEPHSSKNNWTPPSFSSRVYERDDAETPPPFYYKKATYGKY